jgi:hypothetical protein
MIASPFVTLVARRLTWVTGIAMARMAGTARLALAAQRCRIFPKLRPVRKVERLNVRYGAMKALRTAEWADTAVKVRRGTRVLLVATESMVGTDQTCSFTVKRCSGISRLTLGAATGGVGATVGLVA